MEGSRTDIFAECSIDYDRDSPLIHDFYAMVQNKFHYAITGQTAAEIVYTKADHTKDHMGLTTWKNAPDGRVLKSDVSVAKNYLSEKVTNRKAREKAEAEYAMFNPTQKIVSDFDKAVKKLKPE